MLFCIIFKCSHNIKCIETKKEQIHGIPFINKWSFFSIQHKNNRYQLKMWWPSPPFHSHSYSPHHSTLINVSSIFVLHNFHKFSFSQWTRNKAIFYWWFFFCDFNLLEKKGFSLFVIWMCLPKTARNKESNVINHFHGKLFWFYLSFGALRGGQWCWLLNWNLYCSFFSAFDWVFADCVEVLNAYFHTHTLNSKCLN